MGCAPLFEKFMQAIFQTKKKSSLFFIRRRYAAEQAAAVAFGRQLGEKSPPGGRLYIRVRYETGDARHLEASPRGEAVNEVD